MCFQGPKLRARSHPPLFFGRCGPDGSLEAILLQGIARKLGDGQSVFRAVVIDLAALAGGKADGDFRRPGGCRVVFGVHHSGGPKFVLHEPSDFRKQVRGAQRKTVQIGPESRRRSAANRLPSEVAVEPSRFLARDDSRTAQGVRFYAFVTVKLPSVLPEHFLRALPPEERKRLGRSGLMARECETSFTRGEERKLKALVVNFLNLRGAWIFHQSMSRKTGGRPGVPDILCCCRGRFIGIELKVAGSKLSAEQEAEAERIRAAGGRFLVVRRLEDVIAEL